MKKIGKFRKWLIKKLGGVIPCDNKVIITNIRHTKTFESNLKFSFYDHQVLVKSNPFKADIKIKETLWEKLGEQIIPTLHTERYDNIETLEKVFKAKLTIVENDL